MTDNIFYTTIRANKPDITDKSVIAYSSVLKPFYESHCKANKLNKRWFTNTTKVLKLLNDIPNKRAVNILCAILAFLNIKIPEYSVRIIELRHEYELKVGNNEKSDTQATNWKDHKELINIYDEYYKNNAYLFDKTVFTKCQLQIIQNIIILALTCGKYFKVRRSSEWTEFRIDNELDEENDNYKLGNELVFNKFKTVKAFGRQTVILKNDISELMEKFIDIQILEGYLWLFVDKNGNKLSAVTLNQRLNKLYGGHIGTSLIRHIEITDKINKSGFTSVNQLTEEATEHGHSLIEHLQYYKK